MSNDLTVTSTQVNMHLRGIMMHLQASDIAKNYDSFAHAMHDLNLWDFAFNQAEVAAFAMADSRKAYNIIHGVA